jgi:hypothetical protein
MKMKQVYRLKTEGWRMGAIVRIAASNPILLAAELNRVVAIDMSHNLQSSA